jgi:hypothetical protein
MPEDRKATSIWRNVNFWIAITTAVAALCSLGAVIDSHIAAEHAYRLQLKSELRQTLITYLTAFRETTASHQFNILPSISDYCKANTEVKTEVQIVDGLLVSVVDTMYYNNDPRADIWASYIRAIPGPLATGYNLEVYATNEKTMAAIKAAREAILKSAPKYQGCS